MAPSEPLRIGVLTAGGDCPGLNAIIRAVTKTLILHYDAEVIGFEDGYEGLIERRARPLSYYDVSGVLTLGGTLLGTNNKANPFGYYRRDGADVSDEVVAYYHELKLDALVVIGGDGSMAVAAGLIKKGLNIVGVPKTIDNDLLYCERTPGFDSAVQVVTDAVDRLHTTAMSHHRIMILETMGRYAGWIALYGGVAGGADVILIPELPYQIEEVARVCQRREHLGKRFTIIVVAEGARPEGGDVVIREVDPTSPDPIRLGGIGQFLARHLKQHVTSEIRTTVLGHIQRGGTPSPLDRVLGTQLGTYAAHLAARGIYGKIVTVQENRLTEVPIEKVGGKTRHVPPDHPLIAAALSTGTSLGVAGLEISSGAGGPVL